MKSLTKTLFLISGALFLLLPESLSALAMFSRQTGKSCMACHAQNIPKLNSYGREFALSGYTLYDNETKSEALIEGADVPLGLSSSINIAAVLKASYIKTTQTQTLESGELVGKGRGELEGLDGSGVYLGGRIANNFGGIFALKGDSVDNSNIAYNIKLAMSYPILSGYGGMSLISTQTNGIFSGMENYNTGLSATLKQFENSYATNALQATGMGNGPATGLQAYYGNKNVFLTAGIAVPSQNTEGIDAGYRLLPFWRVSLAQPIGNLSVMLGAYGFKGNILASDQSLNGEIVDGNAALVKVRKEGYGLDLEVDGDIYDMSTMTTLNYVAKNIVHSDSSSLLTSYNLQNTNNKAASVEFQINPVDQLALKAAYLRYSNKDATTTNQRFIKNYSYETYTIGTSYLFYQNLLLGVDVSRYYQRTNHTRYHEAYVTAAFAF
jgi:hypothetical protein